MGEQNRTERIATELLSLLGTDRRCGRIAGLDFEEAYAIGERIRTLREARGERPVGRKIGFTNTTIWPLYGVSGPMWSYVYDTTVHDLVGNAGSFALAGLQEPRIEPEIVLHLHRAPQPGMDEADVFGCVDWVAHGFEIVQSVFPRWTFSCAESAAAFGLHGALFIGERHGVAADRARWLALLNGLSVSLRQNDAAVAEGHACSVLGGPVKALMFLVAAIEQSPGSRPLSAGEIVTTGTLTDAQPLSSGQSWSTTLSGVPIDGLRLALIEDGAE